MRKHRMFHVGLITDDIFTSLSISAQLLYMRMILFADDDGFVGNLKMLSPRKPQMKELISAKLIHQFDSGHVLILHWFWHNSIKSSIKKDTAYQDEKALVILDENDVYRLKTEGESDVFLSPKEKISKEKKSKDKKSKEKESEAAEAAAASGARSDTDMEKNFSLFWDAYPKKIDQEETKRVFMSLEEDFATIMEGLEHHKSCKQWISDDGCFIPDPKNWLKRKGWTNRPPVHKPKPASSAFAPMGATGQLGAEELAAIQRVLADG